VKKGRKYEDKDIKRMGKMKKRLNIVNSGGVVLADSIAQGVLVLLGQ